MSTKNAKIVAKTKKHDQFQIIRFGQLKLVKGLECENVQCLHCSSSISLPTLIYFVSSNPARNNIRDIFFLVEYCVLENVKVDTST